MWSVTELFYLALNDCEKARVEVTQTLKVNR